MLPRLGVRRQPSYELSGRRTRVLAGGVVGAASVKDIGPAPSAKFFAHAKTELASRKAAGTAGHFSEAKKGQKSAIHLRETTVRIEFEIITLSIDDYLVKRLPSRTRPMHFRTEHRAMPWQAFSVVQQ